MDYNEIVTKIITYKSLYEENDLEVPSYRITRDELKILFNTIKKNNTHKFIIDDASEDNYYYDDIKSFMGVPLQVVTIG